MFSNRSVYREYKTNGELDGRRGTILRRIGTRRYQVVLG